MEKTLKTLNVTLNRNADAKMMVMALLNGKLALRMGCEDIRVISDIISDVDVRLSADEQKFIAKRLIDSISKFHDVKKFCKNKNQKYDELLKIVSAEVGKETSVITMIQADVTGDYDVSELSTSEISDICCWLAAKSVLVNIPAMESLVAVTSYRKQRGKIQGRDNIVVLGHNNEETADDAQNSSSKNELTHSGNLKNTNDVDEMINCLIDIILDETREDIYHQILSEVEIDFIREDWDDANKRLSSAVDKYNMTDKVTMDVSERYRHLVKCVMSELAQMPVLSDVYSDVSQMYDLSNLSVSGVTELLCWLIIFNLLYGEEPPVTEMVPHKAADVRPKKKKKKQPCPVAVAVNNNQPGKTEQQSVSSSSGTTNDDVAVAVNNNPDVTEMEDNEYLTRGKSLNIFQTHDLRNSVSTGNFCASRMFSIFG